MQEQQWLMAEFTSLDRADTALQILESASFDAQSVSLLTHRGAAEFEKIDQPASNAVDSPAVDKSVQAGTLVGGTVGAMLGTVSMVGPFLVGGPLLGMAAGAGLGVLVNAANQYGLSETELQELKQRVASGHVVILVHENPGRINQASRLLQTTDPHRLRTFHLNSESDDDHPILEDPTSS